MQTETIMGIAIVVGLAIVIFLLCREVTTWYFKINKRIKLMEENNALQRDIIEQLKKNNASVVESTNKID